MTIQLTIDYEQLVALVDQLSEDQRTALLLHLVGSDAKSQPLSVEEKIRLLDAAKMNPVIQQSPSIRREDWYGDDGR